MGDDNQRENVFPTRQSLGLMKTKLKGATTGHSLLKRKSEALTKQFRTIIKSIDDTKMEMGRTMQLAAFSLAEMSYVTGDEVKYQILESARTSSCRLKTKHENISGVFLPVYECVINNENDHRLIGLGKGGQQVQKCQETHIKAINILVKLASLQVFYPPKSPAINNVDRLYHPRRRHQNYKPQKNTIKYINSELEELEREDFTRLKKIQVKKKRDIDSENKKYTSAAPSDASTPSSCPSSLGVPPPSALQTADDDDIIF
ncbi:H(+)-transporting V1 sector ATPase subunit D [Pneumocystis jirovecii RU7]|uniref:V-type proton ATPase subunit D n=1 Tax=Pneumocystis jirovecii (strain RU7) TaxID=1408657 RepID=A0A0W4ZTG3_PNEJ7|nr:H(+)-transporting V1 sector ATPase subunit D [Pneumocystis jirovecii RU7]KTW31661.1 hypothetical protein T551_00922 [Pneumocystis jirovecii RU7]